MYFYSIVDRVEITELFYKNIKNAPVTATFFIEGHPEQNVFDTVSVRNKNILYARDERKEVVVSYY